MRFQWKTIVIPCLLFLAWQIMNESFTPVGVLVGVAVTAFCLYTTNALLGIRYTETYFLPPLPFARYLLFLVKEIYRNGILSAILIVKGKVGAEFLHVEIDKSLQNPFLHTVLAASVTLTPGTISIESKDGFLRVLSMHHNEKEPCKALETQLTKLEKN